MGEGRERVELPATSSVFYGSYDSSVFTRGYEPRATSYQQLMFAATEAYHQFYGAIIPATHFFIFAATEAYHQFYKGPSALKAEQQALGRINPTGCPEQGRFWR